MRRELKLFKSSEQNDVLILDFKYSARWTFFRVKLVFECDFEISWSLRPWDLGTLGPLSSSYLFLLLFSFGMVWYGGRGGEL